MFKKNNTQIAVFILALCSSINSFAQELRYEKNQTLSYPEVISAWQSIDRQSDLVDILEMGLTDAGIPLHLVLISSEKNPKNQLAKRDKIRILINNGIHPGEPDGIDASLQLVKDVLKKGNLPNDVLLCIIPAYNIDGMLNRNCCSRANQNGPEEYGFRGNARNLDLNRDFIKNDSRNAQSFVQLFQLVDPHILVDTHVSNGADYQYTMTLLMTQPDKLGAQGEWCRSNLIPHLYSEMEKKNQPMIPYVNHIGKTPESGIADFLETPRFATGYAALWGCIGITTETHMLKAYPDRVKATTTLLHIVIESASLYKKDIQTMKEKFSSFQYNPEQMVQLGMNYELDTNRQEQIPFLGYEAVFEPSKISGETRLRYDRNKPYKKNIPYYNHYQSTLKKTVPKAYIIPFAWKEVIDRLKLNHIAMLSLQKDSSIKVTSTYINSFETVKKPYEGHYLHYNTRVTEKQEMRNFHKGDVLVYTSQPAWRFLVETLEPESVDSYFNWNFFDAIVQQKEWFSDYVFEDYAENYLKEHPELEEELKQKKANDPEFAKDGFAQLYFIYLRSPYYEKTHNLYPVAKLF
ncbi:MAG: hypothetical protein K1X56_12720 [Flavobacteriales bacterium]|nr:hypothetical protein [Flavobacteriales bacterium]